MKALNIPIGLGTAAIGRPHYINLRQETADAFSMNAFKLHGLTILDEAYLQGIRYFDTAPGYGIAEQLLIDWLADRGHDDVEVATKWGYTYTADFDATAAVHEVKEHSLEKLNEQWAQSQHLLPYLSTYQIHSATFESGVLTNHEVLARLGELKAAHGLHMGLTTTGENQLAVLREAVGIEIEGVPLFDVFQVTYNLLDQSLSELITSLAAQGKRIVIKEALANGRLFPNTKYPHYVNLYQELERLAAKYAVGVDAIALRFCLDAVGPFCVLSGASQVLHIEANLKAASFQLEAAEIQRLVQYGVSPEVYWDERKRLGWG